MHAKPSCVHTHHSAPTTTAAQPLVNGGMQRTRDVSSGEFATSKALQDAIASAATVPRNEKPHVASLYLSACVSQMFLMSAEGQLELERADAASLGLWQAACDAHAASPGGAVLEYGWAMIRALHEKGPGPLHLWGREERLPAATSPATGALRPYRPLQHTAETLMQSV